jgi:anion-transporting  ArsA/GET3 family ATPase
VLLKLLEEPTRYLFPTVKGGVGKTTIAAAVAVELASRGVPVHLSTTDPDGHTSPKPSMTTWRTS